MGPRITARVYRRRGWVYYYYYSQGLLGFRIIAQGFALYIFYCADVVDREDELIHRNFIICADAKNNRPVGEFTLLLVLFLLGDFSTDDIMLLISSPRS
jgi:hypothetical protein